MGEIVWLGNIVDAYSNTPRYLYRKEGDITTFRTIKDKCEIAYYDEKLGVLYINNQFRTQFKPIKKQIIRDYAPKSILEYCYMV